MALSTNNLVKEITPDEWRAAQYGEANFWAQFLLNNGLTCEDDFLKFVVMSYFEIHPDHTDFGEETLVDVGGGPIGILTMLKAKRKIVVDPLPIPTKDESIERLTDMGEEIHLPDEMADKVFLYNVLQHVMSPEKVMKECWRILKTGGTFFILEQINDKTEDYITHPHYLTPEFFQDMFFYFNEVTGIKWVLDKNCEMRYPHHRPDCNCDFICIIVKKGITQCH